MPETEALLRDISDTARWVAVYRARETERPDAVFSDPLARRLAGERGEKIADSVFEGRRISWPFVARTWLVDRLVADLVRDGADLVINLAAGLDTRPYRMDLPGSLRWVEVDLPGILAYKEDVLRGEKPRCALERVALDLSDAPERRKLLDRLSRGTRRAAIVAEGVLVYLNEVEVGEWARDLAAPSAFEKWIVDLGSPRLIRFLSKHIGAPLGRAGAPLRFAPSDGPDFFARHGWRPSSTHSIIHAAARLKRLPFFLRLVAAISSPRFNASRPWSAVCLLEKGRSGIGSERPA